MTALVQMGYFGYNTGVVNRKVDRGATGIAHGLSPEKDLLMNPNDTSGAPAFKTCSKCGEAKPLSEFYIHKSGADKGKYWAFCRACDIARGRKYRAENSEAVTRKRSEYNEQHREYIRVRDRERIESPEVRQRRAELTKQWRKNNQEHVANYAAQQWLTTEAKARQAVYNAVRRGDFPPATAQVCECCQESVASHYHHHKGYSEEHTLDVIALCTECHGKQHRKVE